MAEAKVKKTRVRRPKERPPFYKAENTTVKIPILKIEALRQAQVTGTRLICCPYTKYIPLQYITNSIYTGNVRPQSDFIKRFMEANGPNYIRHNVKILPQLIYHLLDHVMCNVTGTYRINENNYSVVKNAIQGFITADNRSTFNPTRYSSTIDQALTFFESGTIVSASMRSYRADMGMFSAIIGENPHILAVCTPRQYIYHKCEMLLGKPIDLSKVIILVDRQLDLPEEDNIPKAFKALYTKSLEPTILSTPAKVFKVPLSYIKDNCFIGKFEIKARKREEREDEMYSFLSDFYKSQGIVLPDQRNSTKKVRGLGLASSLEAVDSVNEWLEGNDTSEVVETEMATAEVRSTITAGPIVPHPTLQGVSTSEVTLTTEPGWSFDEAIGNYQRRYAAYGDIHISNHLPEESARDGLRRYMEESDMDRNTHRAPVSPPAGMSAVDALNSIWQSADSLIMNPTVVVSDPWHISSIPTRFPERDPIPTPEPVMSAEEQAVLDESMELAALLSNGTGNARLPEDILADPLGEEEEEDSYGDGDGEGWDDDDDDDDDYESSETIHSENDGWTVWTRDPRDSTLEERYHTDRTRQVRMRQ